MNGGKPIFTMCGDIVRISSHVLFFIVAISIVCHCISFTVVASEPVDAQYGFSDLGNIDPLAFDPYALDPLSFSLAADGESNVDTPPDGGELESESFSFDTFDWNAYERSFNPDFKPKYDAPFSVIPFQSTGISSVPVVIDSGGALDSGVVDSGNQPKAPKPNVDTNTANQAIVDIRNYMFFTLYGVFPLMCALLIVYLFSRWIYRLIVYFI